MYFDYPYLAVCFSFYQAPYLMQQLTLNDAISRAKSVHDEEVRRLATLASSHLEALRQSDSSYKEEEFYDIVKEVRSVITWTNFKNYFFLIYAKKIN